MTMDVTFSKVPGSFYVTKDGKLCIVFDAEKQQIEISLTVEQAHQLDDALEFYFEYVRGGMVGVKQ